MRLDHQSLGLLVPREGDRPDAKLLDERQIERRGVGELGRCDRRHRRLAGRAKDDAVEEFLDALGERCDLLLLEHDARGLFAGPGLEVERPLTWTADRARHEPGRRVVPKHLPRHAASLRATC